MLRQSQSGMSPETIHYTTRPDGIIECYMRKDIIKAKDAEMGTYYSYSEVYFQTTETLATITADFDTYWAIGEKWEPSVPQTDAEKLADMASQITDLQLALVTIYTEGVL